MHKYEYRHTVMFGIRMRSFLAIQNMNPIGSTCFEYEYLFMRYPVRNRKWKHVEATETKAESRSATIEAAAAQHSSHMSSHLYSKVQTSAGCEGHSEGVTAETVDNNESRRSAVT